MGEPETGCAPGTLGGPSRRLVLFGDTVGLPQLLRALDRNAVVGLVAASLRPEQHPPLTKLSEAHGLPLLLQPRAGDAAYANFARRLRELTPDLLIVNSYAMVLRPDILAIPRFGAINVHGALLPGYRGANPTEWALINGERETGVTIHAIDAGIDTGPILAQRKVPIRFEDTWLDVRQRVGEATDGLLAETLPGILAGGVQLSAQEESVARHWRRRTAEDGRFDWSQPAIDIYNLVRALVAPHPGASVGGEAIRERMSVAEILWRKHRAGCKPWADAGWTLVPSQPTGTQVALNLEVRRLDGSAVGQCRIDDLAKEGETLAVWVDPGKESVVRTLVIRFAKEELRRTVTFA
jgi:methionyl-tRNA formyltransferase